MTLRSVFLALLLIPAMSAAADLDADSSWFVHINLDAMRSASDDGALYGWLEREVITDVEEEFGEGSIASFEAITVFGSADGEGIGILMSGGNLDDSFKEQLLTRTAALPLEDAGGTEAYAVGEDSEMADKVDIELDEGSLFMGFDDSSDAFLTTRRALLDSFLAGDRFAADRGSDLLVIRADSLLHGGVDASGMGMGQVQWDSKIMRNIRQAGFSLSDVEGGYSVAVELLAVDETQAQALMNIVQGLIGLRTLADEEPDLAFLDGLETQRDADRVKLSVQIGADQLMDMLD